jgi:hypothetical protein
MTRRGRGRVHSPPNATPPFQMTGQMRAVRPRPSRARPSRRVGNLSPGLCSRRPVSHSINLDSAHGPTVWTPLPRLAIIPWTLLTQANRRNK